MNDQDVIDIAAFPVGTGIYRVIIISEIDGSKRSLWVQGYTGSCSLGIAIIAAFPVGTGIYREI